MPQRSHFKVMLALGSLILVAAALSADKSSPYQFTDKAFYADQAQLNFVRPGLVVKITKAEIAADGTVTGWVTVTDPKGAGLDREGITSPGVITLSWLIGYIPADGTQYTSYITRVRTGAAGTFTQATGENTGKWEKLAEGSYKYTFLNKVPAGHDKNATHTVGIYGNRNLDEFEYGRQYADNTLTFVPSGAAVTKVRDVIRTASCNKCHDSLGLHGGSRKSVDVCIICHQPQTTDSATGNTVDLKVMIHKIHFGRNLPSVKVGTPYKVASLDFSTVVFPSPIMACKACHEPRSAAGATQSDNWNLKPTRAACGACHDDVNFATGLNHVNLPQPSDNLCATCHIPQGEVDYDASIKGAHTVPIESSLLKGIVFTIDGVTGAAPGKSPTVAFTVKDKSGNPVDVATMNNMRVYMGGPTGDISGYVREDALKAVGPGDGRHYWTFAATIPATAKGSWQFGLEGYRTTIVLEGTTKQRTIRDYGINKMMYVSVDGTPVAPRRTVVASANCNKCHYQLAFHGGGRNTAEHCTFCHNPNLVANGESFHLPSMIHRFHEEARYPGILRDCNQCHVGNSQQPVSNPNLLPTNDPKAPYTPVPPITNACLSCHNTPDVWSHAKANTTSLGESCTVCHGANAEFSVGRVHAQ
ncbi:MAG: OmcA/MtrC family decaheme c-type cytochrome [Candidatus Solibacter usitatus]|nr:OmcA/MtrC family decaheme c-type cytochrome [Candidatus Solibacter usitatus]